MKDFIDFHFNPLKEDSHSTFDTILKATLSHVLMEISLLML